MSTKFRSIVLTSLGLLLAFGSIAGTAILDRPLSRPQSLSFASPQGDRLAATYYAGTQPWGVILLEGFGSDQVTMRSLASEFARSGWHVFTFDFSGHGRSGGALSFDNARTDLLANETLAALDQFQAISGLQSDQIVVAGHSLGARIALQSATMNPDRVAGLVLLGTQVNLSTNVQSEFFTGTTDADLPWVQALGADNPPVPILLISGRWDDILTPANAQLLYEKLGEDQAAFPRELIILSSLFHNYEPFSPRVLSWSRFVSVILVFSQETGNRDQTWMEFFFIQKHRMTNPPNVAPYWIFPSRILAWVVGFLGLLLAVLGGGMWTKEAFPVEEQPMTIEVASLKRFLWGKLLLWLAALPVAAVLGSLFFFIPLGKPVFNLIYVGFIGGYGVLLAILYGRGKVPGVKGKMPFSTLSRGDKRPPGATVERRILATLVLGAGMLGLTAAYARTGWFYVFPLNLRLVWLAIFVPFTALGFWIGQYENRIVQAAGGGSGSQVVLTLIGLFPFFLYTILMAALGSLSGMIGGLQGLLILALVLAFGNLVQEVGRRPGWTAFWMAVLLYWLILPQGVLFR